MTIPINPPIFSKIEDLPEDTQAYARESERRSQVIQEAFAQIDLAKMELAEAMRYIRTANTGVTRCRSLSLAYTAAEEATLWLKNVEGYAVAPHDVADQTNATM